MDEKARSWTPAPKNRPACVLSLLPGYYCPGGAWNPRPLSGPWGDLGPVGYLCPEGSLVATPQPDGQQGNESGTWTGSDSRPELLWKPSTAQGGQGHKMTQLLYFLDQESHQERTCSPSHYCPQGIGHFPLPCPQGVPSPRQGRSPTQGFWPCFAGEKTDRGSWGLSRRQVKAVFWDLRSSRSLETCPC